MHHKWPRGEPLGFGFGEWPPGFGCCFQRKVCMLTLRCLWNTENFCKGLPGLRIATPIAEVEYTPPTRDVGIIKLPVEW